MAAAKALQSTTGSHTEGELTAAHRDDGTEIVCWVTLGVFFLFSFLFFSTHPHTYTCYMWVNRLAVLQSSLYGLERMSVSVHVGVFTGALTGDFIWCLLIISLILCVRIFVCLSRPSCVTPNPVVLELKPYSVKRKRAMDGTEGERRAPKDKSIQAPQNKYYIMTQSAKTDHCTRAVVQTTGTQSRCMVEIDMYVCKKENRGRWKDHHKMFRVCTKLLIDMCMYIALDCTV